MAKWMMLVVVYLLMSGPALANTDKKAQLWELYKDGNRLKYVELVLADLEQWDAMTLLTAATMAVQEQQLNEAELLYQTGTLRAKIDSTYYVSTEKGGNGPAPAIQGLIFSIQMPRSRLSQRQIIRTYQAIIPQLEQWKPRYNSAYDPGWNYQTAPDFPRVQHAFDAAKVKRIQVVQGWVTLFSDKAYVDAYDLVKSYESNQSTDQPAGEKVHAEERMQRIESALGVAGYMAGVSKIKEIIAATRCFKSSADGSQKEVEC